MDNYESQKFIKIPYIFLWSILAKEAGGMTRALLNRANFMISVGCNVKILCAGRGMEQIDSIYYYKTHGYDNITENNFVLFEDYMGNKLQNSNSIHFIDIDLCDCIEERINDKTILYYKQGLLYAKKKFFESSEKYEVIKYDLYGNTEDNYIYYRNRLVRIERIFQNRKIVRYISPSGFIYMTAYFEKYDNEWKTEKIYLFDENKKNKIEFKNWEEIYKFFYVDYCENIQENEVCVFNDRILRNTGGFWQLGKIKNKQIYRIGIVHGIGIRGKRDWNDDLYPTLHKLIKEPISPNLDGLVVCSKEQKNDYEKAFGKRDILYSIPNFIKYPESVTCYCDRNPYRAVYIGRLDEKVKQISHILKAWKTVEKNIPKAELHIYGKGESENQLKNLVNDLELKNVFFEGFSAQVDVEFQKASVSLYTSDYEAFSISFLESLANGCPIIAYNYKYGVKDILDDGLNGFLVEKNNVELLADTLINFFSLPAEKKIKMSDAARKSVEKYSNKYCLDYWKKAVTNIIEKANYKTDIKKIRFYNEITRDISHVQTICTGCFMYEGIIPENSKDLYRVLLRKYRDNDVTFIEEGIKIISKNDREIKFEYVIEKKEHYGVCLAWCNSYFEERVFLD